MIEKLLGSNNPEKLSCTFSLRNGCIFFATIGIMLWCSELPFGKRYKIVTYMNETRHKLLIVVFSLYFTCVLAFIIHISIRYYVFN